MKSKVAILLIIVFMFNGLNDARQLNDLSILSAVGIDIDESGEYIITSQVLNTQKADNSSGSASSGTSVVVYETKRKSVHEALRSTIEKVPKKLYIAHLELLLISEEAAKKDLSDTLDFFLRDNEGGNNFMIVVTKDTTPQEVLSTLSAINPDPAKAVSEGIKSTYEYEGTSTDYLLYDTLDMVLNDKRGIVLASMTIDRHNENYEKDEEIEEKQKEDSENQESASTEDKSSSNSENGGENKSGGDSSNEQASTNHFKITELAYFSKRSFKGYMEENDAIVYNLLQNKLKGNVLRIDDKENLLVFEINKGKSNLTPEFKNGNFLFDIDVKIEGNISELGKNVRENMRTNYSKYKKKIEDTIKCKIEDAINNYKYKYEEDIIGFENLIYKKLNKEYKKVKDEFYEKYFKNIEVNVNVEVNFPLEGGDMVDGSR